MKFCFKTAILIVAIPMGVVVAQFSNTDLIRILESANPKEKIVIPLTHTIYHGSYLGEITLANITSPHIEIIEESNQPNWLKVELEEPPFQPGLIPNQNQPEYRLKISILDFPPVAVGTHQGGVKVKLTAITPKGLRTYDVVFAVRWVVLLPLQWADVIGGSGDDVASCIQQTADTGCVIAGYTESLGNGDKDIWVLKYTYSGDLDWIKTFGGKDEDKARSIVQTREGDYILVGRNGIKPEEKTGLVLKLDGNGDVVWQKNFGNTRQEELYSIQLTLDNKYIVAGYINPLGCDDYDIWILKLDNDGSIIWEKTIGETSVSEYAYFIQPTSDGSFYIVGHSSDSQLAFVAKLDKNGDILWEKEYGGKSIRINDMALAADDGCVLTGEYEYHWGGALSYDLWLLCLDKNGEALWEKKYGSKRIKDMGYSVRATIDEGYVVAGATGTNSAGSFDFWLLKLNQQGDLVWDRTYGGKYYDAAFAVQQALDEGYYVTGTTDSYGGGLRKNIWSLKTDKRGVVPEDELP